MEFVRQMTSWVSTVGQELTHTRYHYIRQVYCLHIAGLREEYVGVPLILADRAWLVVRVGGEVGPVVVL